MDVLLMLFYYHVLLFIRFSLCKTVHLWNGSSETDVNYIASATRECT